MLWLHGIGHFHPQAEITNRFLGELDIGTSDSWIMERVGIRARRTTLPLDYIRHTRNRDLRATREASEYSNAELGARAAELAIKRAGISKADIGVVVSGSSAPDTLSPAEACNVANALELEVPAFDVNSACSSFFAGLYLLSMMQPERLPSYVLLVAPEGLTRSVDYSDRASAVLFGDAACAAVLSTTIPGVARILGNTLESNPAGGDKVVIPRAGFFYQQGRAVQMLAIKKTIQCLSRLGDEYRNGKRSFHFVGHQANRLVLEAACRQCEIPDELHHSNVEWFGNTGAASSGSVLSMTWDNWTAQDDVAVVGVGAGLSWGSYLMRFEGRA